MTPKHTHDCPNCRFLGTIRNIDHYACHATDGTPRVTLVQRESSHGPDYDSFTLSEGLHGPQAALLEAGPACYSAPWAETLRLARAFDAGFQRGLAAPVEVEFGCPDCEGEGRIWNNADRTSGQWVPCSCSAGDDVELPDLPDHFELHEEDGTWSWYEMNGFKVEAEGHGFETEREAHADAAAWAGL